MAGMARALILCVALGFGLAALPAPASAQNASVAGTLEAYPTYQLHRRAPPVHG